MPDGVTWSRPAGGVCCWVTLPPNSDLAALYQAALDNGMIFTPGNVFLARPVPRQHLRLCFGEQSSETIRSAVELLGTLIIEQQTRQSPAQGEESCRASRPLV